MRTRSWLIALLVAFSITSAPRALGQGADTQILDFFKSYDAAFNAKDLAKLATLYHPEVTIFEGAGINRGWADYRDNHLGPELKSFQNLQWAHSNIVVHVLGEASAYVTAEYSIKLLRPTPTNDSVFLSAKVVEISDDRATIEGTLSAGGKVCATCRGVFVAVKEGHPAYHRW